MEFWNLRAQFITMNNICHSEVQRLWWKKHLTSSHEDLEVRKIFFRCTQKGFSLPLFHLLLVFLVLYSKVLFLMSFGEHSFNLYVCMFVCLGFYVHYSVDRLSIPFSWNNHCFICLEGTRVQTVWHLHCLINLFRTGQILLPPVIIKVWLLNISCFSISL